MSIHLARDGSALGIFTLDEVRAGLASGRFRHSDLAWREGMPAWTALSSWPEFSTVGSMLADAPASSATEIPWEREKSFGSFLATLRLALASPATGLAVGRYAFGDWLAFAYLTFALALPFQIIGLLLADDRNRQLAEFLEGLGLNDIAEKISAQPTETGIAIVGMVLGTFLAPLIYAALGLLLWLMQRVFGHKTALERTVSAALLAISLVTVVTAPINLLGFNIVLQMLVGLLAVVPWLILYFRALGAATGISPWAQFGMNLLLAFILCCCCCFLPAAFLGLLMG